MAKGAESGEKKKTLSTQGLPKMRLKQKLLLYLFSLTMIALIRQGFIFLVIGMLPTIVAYYMDVSKHRYTFRSIFAANLCGMLPYLARILAQGPSSALLHSIMGSSTTWITVYGASLVGWMLVLACPILAQAAVLGVHQAQLARYSQLQKKLESEWGPEVMQFSGEHAARQED